MGGVQQNSQRKGPARGPGLAGRPVQRGRIDYTYLPVEIIGLLKDGLRRFIRPISTLSSATSEKDSGV